MPQVVESAHRSPRNPDDPEDRRNRPGGPSRGRAGWLWMLAALAVGLMLFLLVWNNECKKQYFTVDPVAKPTTAEEYKPLPMPVPGNAAADAGDQAVAAQRPSEKPRIEEPAAPPVRPAPPPQAQPPAPASQAAPATASSVPLPISQPPPEYPRNAMQAAREGRVRVRAEIGPDGAPTDTSLVESSGDRDLDRAALRGVMRWRFKPAMANGQPVSASVIVPIEFRLSQ